jgi:hypothetical protein
MVVRAFQSKLSLLLVLAVPVIVLAGCQTAPQQPAAGSGLGDSQSIAIDTPGVPRAKCVLNSVTVGRVNVTTPAQIEVDRSPEIIVVSCRKRCFLDASAMIASEGQRLASGVVVYSYPGQTLVKMSPAAKCDAPSAGGRGAFPL